MLFKPNPSSGLPIYLQLMEQVKYGIETGALGPGEELPGIRRVAVELVVNPNTVAKAYRELEHEGVIELRQGAGAFVVRSARARVVTQKLRNARPVLSALVAKLREIGLGEGEMRRWFEAELMALDEKYPGDRKR
jgi:GntR family transcriptional regulator